MKVKREELKEIISRVVKKVLEEEQPGQAPSVACIWRDTGPCDVTTFYAVGEEY